MKPFNLERALAGDPVGTRDGARKVVQIFHADKAICTERLFTVFDNGAICMYFEDGKVGIAENDRDLVMLPKTRTYWYAICRSKGAAGTYRYATALFEDKEELLKIIDANKIISILSIDIEENE